MPDFASRRWRRLLVLSLYVGQLVAAGFVWQVGTLDPGGPEGLRRVTHILHVLFPFAMAIALASFLLLFVATQQVGVLADTEADERQRMVRNRAYYLAYRIVGIVLGFIALGVVAVAAGKARAHTPFLLDGTDVAEVLPVLVFNMAFLPTVVLAWTEPD